ncbi:MAPK-activated protein kinase Srk1 [Saitoella coloradoensis]
MPMIENLKNFIRHGKQARQQPSPANPNPQPHHQPYSDPYPATANVDAHPTRDAVVAAAQQNVGHNTQISKGAVANAHQAAAQAVHTPEQVYIPAGAQVPQGVEQQKSGERREYDEAAARIVAEEREARGKLPRYPLLDEKYKLIEKMGDGAFSNVYKAQDRKTGSMVAVKVVRKYELNASQGDKHLHAAVKQKPKGIERANILKEVQIMRNLNHPNIVQLYEFSESRDYYFLIMELVPGGELFHQIVRLTYFSEDLSRNVITQVAHAVRYLHEEKGVVHRDIKPENLLFEPITFIPSKTPKVRTGEDEDKEDEGEFIPGVGAGGIGRIKLADFGLSKVVWDSQTMTPCGTVGYTAPEIVKDERYSKSVDMWAMGCVLYTLLCGFPPFYDESIQVLTEKVARGQYTFLSPWWDEISKSAQDLISHLLTVDPEKRYTIDEFLAHPWIRGTDEETQPAADAPPTAGLHNRQYDFTSPMSLDTPVRANRTPGIPETPGGTRADFRSPGVVALREVFDVSYAVHRMEEEGARRKNAKHANYRTGGFANLNAMDEDEEAEAEAEAEDRASTAVGGGATGGIENDLRKATIDPAKKRRVEPMGPPKTGGVGVSSQRRRAGGFELNLDKATLLGRRNKGPGPALGGLGAAAVGSSPLANTPMTAK